MKQQKGSISIHRNNWILRFRENVPDGNGGTVRRKQFKVLGPVTADHLRSKDRVTKKPRIPDEIQALANDIMGSVKSASTSVSVLTTIGEYVDGIFLPEKEQTLKAGSYDALLQRWEYYLKARISSKVLRDFERKDAAQLFREIHKDMPHLSGQTMRHIRFALSGIFEAAKDAGLFKNENPATASLPANLRGKRKTGAYSLDEVARMLNLLGANPQAQAIIAVTFCSGARKGEVMGLRWTDYEPTADGAMLTISRNCWRGKIVESTKTTASTDTVSLDSTCCEYVDAYRKLAGDPEDGQMFVNHHDNGNPLNADSFARWQLKPLFRKAGIEWKGWHAFRRGAATCLAQQRTIEGRQAATLVLRHTNASTTQEHYIQESRLDRAAAQAGKVLSIQQARKKAAGAIGEGLKQATGLQ